MPSNRGKSHVPHLRWSQAPPRPQRRPRSADNTYVQHCWQCIDQRALFSHQESKHRPRLLTEEARHLRPALRIWLRQPSLTIQWINPCLRHYTSKRYFRLKVVETWRILKENNMSRHNTRSAQNGIQSGLPGESQHPELLETCKLQIASFGIPHLNFDLIQRFWVINFVTGQCERACFPPQARKDWSRSL